MSLVEFFLKFSLLIFLSFLLYYQFNKGNLLEIKLNVATYFLTAYFLYIILPIFEVLIKNEVSEFSSNFLNDAILTTTCLNIGALIARFIKLNKNQGNPFHNSEMNLYKKSSKASELFKVIIATVICISFITIFIVVNKGGFYNYFTLGYGNRTGTEESTIIASLVYSVVAYAAVFNNKRIITTKLLRYWVHITTVLFILIFLLGGSRNFAIMILFAMLLVIFKDKKFNVIGVATVVIAGILGMGFIAVFREYGIMNVLQGEVVLSTNNVLEYVFNFRKGELGTTMNFSMYDLSIDRDFTFPFGYGYSYIILPIINLIPRFIWENKPSGYADYFSSYAFGTSNGIGFGFSPIYEAKINFGFLWGIVFVFFGFLIMWLYKKINKENTTLKMQLFSVALASIMLNFFRIDFTTFFKFLMMIWVFTLIFYKLTMKKKKLKLEKDLAEAQ